MVAFKYPMSKGQYVGKITREQLNELCKDYCCMFRIKATYVTPLNNYEHPISASKCRGPNGKPLKHGVVKDNGRVITAEYLEITMTEQDFFTYERYYTQETLEFFDCYIYKKGYLPSVFIKAVLKLYRDKTALKGMKGKELDYALAKEMLNSRALLGKDKYYYIRLSDWYHSPPRRCR